MSAALEIEAVATAMHAIVDTSIERRSAAGYFAAMYLGVTRVVGAGLASGAFTTPERLANLTTVFAQRYLDAWRLHESGEPISGAWQVAFVAGSRWRPTVLQHLLLGMNAHINLDLGIASAQVSPGAAITELRADFDQINHILAGLVSNIQDELDHISPFYRFVSSVSGPVDRSVINFSIARARDEAWKLATFLAAAEPDVAAARIADQDRLTRVLGNAIMRPGAMAMTGLLAVRLTEKRHPVKIIDIISGAGAAAPP